MASAPAAQAPQQAIEKVEPRTPIALGTKGVELHSIEDLWRFAHYVLKSKLAPQAFDTQEKIVIAIELGMNLGLAPMQALSTIAVINGRPCLWGDGLIGIVQASPACAYIREWIEGDGEEMTAFCETLRKGRPEPTRSEFSIADARRAGLLDKAGPWKQYTKRMLQMRARGFCLRDAYPDVLKGIAVAEEITDYVHVETVASRPLEAPRRLSERQPQASDIPFGESASIEQPASAQSEDVPSTPQTDAPPAGADLIGGTKKLLSQAQRGKMFALLSERKISEDAFKAYLRETWGLESRGDVTTDIFAEVMQWISTAGA